MPIEKYKNAFSSLSANNHIEKYLQYKAILLLSIIDLIEYKNINNEKIVLNNILKERFELNLNNYIGSCSENINSLISLLFKYMESESFWHTSQTYMIVNIDRELYNLLTIKNSCNLLRTMLIDNYVNKKDSLFSHKVNFSQVDFSYDKSLRFYQVNNKRKIYEFWQNGKSVMLQMPTGTGKTRVFVSIVKDLHRWGIEHKTAVKVLLLAHRVELIEQIGNNLGIKYGLAHGFIASQNKERKKYPIQVGSVPTLSRRLDKWIDKDFDVIIVDEAHHINANSYKKIINEYPNAKLLGVTATPYRLNGSGFTDIFEKLIISDPVSLFIKEKYLSEYDYYSILPSSKTQTDIENLSQFALNGDYLESAMSVVVDNDRVRAGIVKAYQTYALGKKGIVYTINKAHNEHVCEQFISNGILAKAIDSDTDSKKRQEIVEELKSGKIQVLCNVNIFSEGFDCPDIEFVQLARPTKSLSMYLQQIGRGLRTAINKDKVIYIDNVGLYNKFGLPSAKRYWKKHFEGKEVSAEELKGDDESDLCENNLFFFKDYHEGNEAIKLIHSSLEDKIEDNVINEMEMKNYEKDFCSYMVENGFGSSTINSYATAISKHIDLYIKKFIDNSHKSIFYLVDVNKLEELQSELFKNDNFSRINKEKHNRYSAAVKKYIEFSKSLNSDNIIVDLDAPIKYRTIDEINNEISILEKWGNNIPVELLKEKQKLERKINLPEKVKSLIESEFLNLNEDISIEITFSKKKGLEVCYSNDDTINTHRKTSSNRDKLKVIFNDGSIIKCSKVKETLINTIKKIGVERVNKLKIKANSTYLIDDYISNKPHVARVQTEIAPGLYLNAHSNTMMKKEQIEEISQKLDLNIKIEIV